MNEAPERKKADQQLHVYLTGRVQRVHMRDYVQKTARQLGLNGFVRNLADGSVEALAEGEAALLAEFVQRLQASPVGRVDEVRTTCGPATGLYLSFTIEY